MPATIESVKSLAVVLECGEGEVLDQAVEFFEAHNGGEARVVVSDAPRTAISGSGATVQPKNAHCRHCGNRFAGSKFATICGACQNGGHVGDPRDCGACTEGSSI